MEVGSHYLMRPFSASMDLEVLEGGTHNAQAFSEPVFVAGSQFIVVFC